MRLQISFDLTDLEQALAIAQQVHEYADMMQVGSLLIYKHGITALEQFRTTFPDATIVTDTQVVEHGKESASLFASAQTNWITVLAGANKNTIHAACTTAHENSVKVMLDLIDSREFGQSALEAENLGADALLLHQPYDVEEPLVFLDKWEMVRGNTNLPIYISTRIKRDNIEDIMKVKPDGIIIGSTITQAENPKEEAKFFYDLCNENGG